MGSRPVAGQRSMPTDKVTLLLVSGGASIEMIGKLLGLTQIARTQCYTHLIESPLRAGANAMGEMLRPRLKVVGE